MSRIYYKHLVYTFLGLVDGFVNFMCAVVGSVPCVDLASSFLVYTEYKRVEKEVLNRVGIRETKGKEAEKLMADARDLISDGKDLQKS